MNTNKLDFRIKIPQEYVYSQNIQKFQTEYRSQLVKRIFIDGGFGRIVGKLQGSPDSLEASLYLLWFRYTKR